MNSTITKNHISHMFITSLRLWSKIQDNTEKAILYALLGAFLGLFGVLLVINITLCRKLKYISKQKTNSDSSECTDEFVRRKHCDKISSCDRLHVVERAPSGGWTFHEECSRNQQMPQSFASSPLLPVWDVYVHVDSPHESPALVSISKQRVGEVEPFLQHRNSYQPHASTAHNHAFASKSLPHKLFPVTDDQEDDYDHPLDLVAMNNNNEDENDIWIRRSHLKLDELPTVVQRSSLSEV